MIHVLKQQVNNYLGTANDKYNYLRELLQLLILKKIDEAGYFQKNPHINENELKVRLKKIFNETNYDVVKKDIEVFLSDPNELRFFTKEVFMSAVR